MKNPTAAGSLRRLLDRVRPRLPQSPRVLPVLEAYARWAPRYGEPETPLQELDRAVVEELLPNVRGRAALDVGAGRGRIARLLAARGARPVVTSDASLPMLRASSQPLRVAADALALPFGRRFEIATCCLVLGHLPDPDPALDALSRVLAPGGALVLSLFHPDAARRGWRRTFRDPETSELLQARHWVHDQAALRRRIEACGLRIEAERSPRYRGVRVVYALRAVLPRRPSREAE